MSLMPAIQLFLVMKMLLSHVHEPDTLPAFKATSLLSLEVVTKITHL
jgi:hypothetical protein